MIRNFAAVLALAALAACSGSGDQSSDAPQPTETPTATETPTEAATPEATESPVTVSIPESIQGRWGLVAEDCTSTKGDAKGLLTITPTRLQFYESEGRLTDVEELAPNHFIAKFDFTGEGLEWHRKQALDVAKDGKSLVRRELGDDAAPGPFNYIRCS